MSPFPASSLPYQWHLDGNYLVGITSDRWWSLLQQNHFRVSPAYWHRIAATTLMSGLSTVLSSVETWRYDRAIAATELPADPIFILGHWRSGTTFLHELLALDTEQLAYPNTFEVMSPQTFLSTEPLLSRWLAQLVPDHRPMDNMRIGIHSPQEDEFAIALTTLTSQDDSAGYYPHLKPKNSRVALYRTRNEIKIVTHRHTPIRQKETVCVPLFLLSSAVGVGSFGAIGLFLAFIPLLLWIAVIIGYQGCIKHVFKQYAYKLISIDPYTLPAIYTRRVCRME